MSIHNSQAKKRPSYHHDRGQDICAFFLNHTFMPPEFCFSIHINMYKTNLVTAAVPAEFQGPSPSAMMTTWFSQSSEQILIDQTTLFKMTGSILQILTTLKTRSVLVWNISGSPLAKWTFFPPHLVKTWKHEIGLNSTFSNHLYFQNKYFLMINTQKISSLCHLIIYLLHHHWFR